MRRSARQAATAARRARSENDGGSLSGDSWAGQMEADEQQLPGAGDRDRMAAGLNAPGVPAEANMPRGARFGRGTVRPLPTVPAQAPPAGHGNRPFQSPDALAVASVLPLISMVRSQEVASALAPAALDRWHQHGKMFMMLKISPFGEVPMTPGAQQKLLVWLKNTATALSAYRATSLEHEDIVLQRLTEAILPAAKLTWEAAVESSIFEQPLTGARRGVGTGSLIWRTLRTFLRCYDNPHGKDEMEQRLYNWKWSKTVPETMASFNEVVHIWKQAAQQTATLHFARQVDMPTPHAILDQIVKKMPPWAKKHMQEHPGKYTSVPQLWVSLKEEEAVRLTRTTTGNIQAMTVIPHDREQRATILTMAEAILAEEAEHVDGGSPVTPGYGDMTAPISLGLHFLGQQLPRGPNGEFECMRCGDAHFYRKCNAPASLEELAGQHASTWPRVTPVVGNKPGAPPITQAPPGSSVGPITTPYHRPVPAAPGVRAVAAPTLQRGPLQALARSMLDLQHRMTGLERDPGPASSTSPTLLSLVPAMPVVAPVSDSILIEGPGVSVPLDYVPAGIYQGRRVWAAPVADEDHDSQGNGP